MLKIIKIQKLNKKYKKFLNIENTNYEIKNNIVCGYNEFNFIAKINGKIVGILSGCTCYSEVYIDNIVVSEKYRGKGIGKKLIDIVEKCFKNKNYNNINLVTNAFQAPDFYKKCGFELEFKRENKENPDLTKYFFIKYL